MFAPTKPKKEIGPASRRTDLDNTLCQAIRSKITVRLHYKNETYFRTLEPYIIYQHSHGKICVAGVQTRDNSKLSHVPEWREFEIDHSDSILLTQETFKLDPNFSSFTGKFARYEVMCAVDRP